MTVTFISFTFSGWAPVKFRLLFCSLISRDAPCPQDKPTAFSWQELFGTLVRPQHQRPTQGAICDRDTSIFPPKHWLWCRVLQKTATGHGFVAGGWASAQLSPRTRDATAEFLDRNVLPVAWDITWTPDRQKDALSHTVPPRGPGVPALLGSPIAMVSQQPRCCLQAREHLRRAVAGRGIAFPRAEEKHAFTRLHAWPNSPSHPRDGAGIAQTINNPLVFVFRRGCPATCHVQVVLLKKAPQWVWWQSCLCAGSSRSHPPSLQARLCPRGREQFF